MRNKKFLAAALALQAATVAAQAQGDEDELALAYGDKLNVSIATGSRQELRRAPAVATVITAEEIKAMGATDLDQVLETVPGVHVSHDARNTSEFTFRGNVGNPMNPRVLLLQNGIAVNSLYRNDQGESWGGLPLENIARIEIIRGPGSALYGADAFAGVINIITKTAADVSGTELGLRTGSYNAKDAWVLHGGKLGPVDVAAYLRLGSTDGYKGTIASDAATRISNIRRSATTSSLAPGLTHNDADAVDASIDLSYEKLRFRAGYKFRDMAFATGLASALDPVGRQKSERVNADLSWTDLRVAENWGAGANFSYLSYVEDSSNFNQYPPGTVFPNGSVFPNGMIGAPGRWERQVTVTGYATYSGFTGQTWRFGMGHEDLDLYRARTSKNFYLDPVTTQPTSDLAFNGGAVVDYSVKQPHVKAHRRLDNYAYVQDEWNFARDWTLTAGLRHDNFSDFGSTTNPRLALVWDASLDWTAKLLYGKAFRAPAFGEMVGVNPVANGNPNLKPETNQTLEAAVSWQVRGDLQVNVNVFRYNIKDAILAVPNVVGGTAATFQNAGTQNGRGAELEFVWDVSRSLRFTGNYSNQRAVDEVTGADLGYLPHNRLYARADWRFAERWLFSPQIDRVADRKRAAGDSRPEIPNYTNVDLTLRTDRGKNQWSFAGGIRNLFNATILEPSLFTAAPPGRTDIPTSAIPYDLPMPGRSWYLQASYSM